MEIAIIGAGISGLVVANNLKDFANITVFEKSRSVGGRMSTRYDDVFEFDHGAQFFTAKTESFKQFVKTLLEAGYISEWQANFVEIENCYIADSRKWDNFPHYVGVPRMNSVVKYLAQNINVKTRTEIKNLRKQDGKWSLFDIEGNNIGVYDWVITTAPPMQSLELLPKLFNAREILKTIKMQGCYALMLGFNENFHIGFDAALVRQSKISWISVNSTKPQRSTNLSIVILSTNNWADENIEADREFIINELIDSTRKIIQSMTYPQYVNLHKWRYANLRNFQVKKPLIDFENNLAACGDWYSGGKVENAFISAEQLSKLFLKTLFK
jgi:renalase